jgi:hypothetical protein
MVFTFKVGDTVHADSRYGRSTGVVLAIYSDPTEGALVTVITGPGRQGVTVPWFMVTLA